MADIVLAHALGAVGVWATMANLTGAALLASPGVVGDWVRPLGGTIIDGIATSYTEGGAGMNAATVTFQVLLGTDLTTVYDLCNIVTAEDAPLTITLTTTAKNKYRPLAVGSPTTGIAPWLSGIHAIRCTVVADIAGLTTDNVTVIALGRRIAA